MRGGGAMLMRLGLGLNCGLQSQAQPGCDRQERGVRESGTACEKLEFGVGIGIGLGIGIGDTSRDMERDRGWG